MYASFLSIGAYVPAKEMTNQDLERIVDTSDEWIMKRTGIKTRYVASPEEASSDLGTKAAEKAIGRSGIAKEEIDMIICATVTPDYLCMPSTACVIANNLGYESIPAFDISAACTGFVYLVSVAKAYIEAGMAKNILIVGAETYSRILDYSDRTTCVLFGDGAGAAVIGTTENKETAILDVNLGANGKYKDHIITPGGGSRFPVQKDGFSEETPPYIQMKGNETFKVAVNTLANDCEEILRRNDLKAEAISHFVPHQANYRIIKAVGDKISLNDSQIVVTVDKYGNTSAASIPMALNHIYEEGKLKNGELLLLDAFGGGLTWGSALLYFNGQ